MEARLKELLGTKLLKKTGRGGGGCISQGEAYLTDTGTVFVKRNSKSQARLMFDGEEASLRALEETKTVRVPKPIAVADGPGGGALFVMEYLEMRGLNKLSGQLGEQLARLHLHNIEVGKKEAARSSHVQKEESEEEVKYVSQFGFPTTTCCGYIPQDNSWCSDWPTFFARQKLDHQLKLIEKEYGDREARELWTQLQPKIPSFFKGLDIKPSLLHGDLWSGNVAEIAGSPVVFDPACFYGHHEFELSIAKMFGGFSQSFYQAYHALLPADPGFNRRQQLYQLFHCVNHWNHFGSGYRGQSLSSMRSLCK